MLVLYILRLRKYDRKKLVYDHRKLERALAHGSSQISPTLDFAIPAGRPDTDAVSCVIVSAAAGCRHTSAVGMAVGCGVTPGRAFSPTRDRHDSALGPLCGRVSWSGLKYARALRGSQDAQGTGQSSQLCWRAGARGHPPQVSLVHSTLALNPASHYSTPQVGHPVV